jgi:macrolide transport system ATP-binding/permease protein
VRYVSGQYFTALSVPSAAGRLSGPDDDRVGAPLTAVITNDYWRTRFNANPATIGKVIQINNIPVTIAGVAAPNFFGVAPAQKPAVFLPMAAILQLSDHGRPATFTDKNYYWIEMMGRLKPGVTLAQAQSELAGLFHNFVASTASTDRERANLPHLFLQEGGSGVDGLRRDYAKPLWVLMGVVALILAIACANIANLLLARATARRREMAVRLSLGAGRFRVIRQLLTESLMLALMGAIAGTGVAALGIRVLLRLLTNGDDDFSLNVGLDWRVLGFALLVTLVTGILFGLAPAIQATRVDVIPALKETRAGQPRRHRTPFNLRQALVVTQIALSLLLVSDAGLFVRSLNQLNSVQLGFNSQNVLLFNLDATKAGYQPAAAAQLYTQLETRFRSLPGVIAATSSDLPLVGGWMSTTGVEIPGSPKTPEGQRGPNSAYAQVGPDFFGTMQIPIALGRALDARDIAGAPMAAVVNEVFAKKYFPGRSPVGTNFKLDDMDVQIVGVARNARYNSLKQATPPVTYVAWQQAPANHLRDLFFELRTTGDPLLLVNSVRTVVHEVAPQLPVADVTTQQRRIQGTIREERIFAQLCAVFGVLALLMACIGLYGSMAWTVARRTSEIGIRMALGAQRPGIVWMVLREVFALTAVGLAIGGIAVWQTTSLLKSLLFNLKPTDPVTLAAAVCFLLASALLAGYLPARRAARIDPMVALRHE